MLICKRYRCSCCTCGAVLQLYRCCTCASAAGVLLCWPSCTCVLHMHGLCCTCERIYAYVVILWCSAAACHCAVLLYMCCVLSGRSYASLCCCCTCCDAVLLCVLCCAVLWCARVLQCSHMHVQQHFIETLQPTLNLKRACRTHEQLIAQVRASRSQQHSSTARSTAAQQHNSTAARSC